MAKPIYTHSELVEKLEASQKENISLKRQLSEYRDAKKNTERESQLADSLATRTKQLGDTLESLKHHSPQLWSNDFWSDMKNRVDALPDKLSLYNSQGKPTN